MFAWSCDWIINLSLLENLCILHFHINRLLKQYVIDCTRCRANWENYIQRTGTFYWWFFTRFSFCSPKVHTPNKPMTWNTSHLHGIEWSSGKLDYDKLFAVLYDIKILNAEMFAEGLEKFRLLARLLGQIIENLDDYGWPKIQDLVGTTNSSWICSSYPFRQKSRLHCAKRKAKLYGEWAMQHLNL